MMLTQVLGFSVLVVLVLAGVLGAVIKYTLSGKVTSDVSNRVNDQKFAEAMAQSHLEDAESDFKNLERSARELGEDHRNSNSGLRVSHAM